MKRCLFYIVGVAIFAMPAWQWTQNVINPWILFEHQLPPGQWLYLLSKLVAQYAFLFLSVQIAFGLLLAMKAHGLSWLTIKLHRTLGISVFLAVLTHAGLFMAAVTFRTGHFPLQLLSPQFDQGYYNLAISIGVMAAILLILVFLIGLTRNQIPRIVFHYGHRLGWIVWFMGLYHSIAIGSETAGNFIWSSYYLMAAFVILVLFVCRLYSLIKPQQLIIE